MYTNVDALPDWCMRALERALGQAPGSACDNRRAHVPASKVVAYTIDAWCGASWRSMTCPKPSSFSSQGNTDLVTL